MKVLLGLAAGYAVLSVISTPIVLWLARRAPPANEPLHDEDEDVWVLP